MNLRSLEILLVEDDPVFADLAKTTLEEDDGDCAITVCVATDGEEALQFLRRKGEFSEAVRPDLILLDINLPKMNGFEVLVDVKADDQLRRIPVVILTVSADEHDILKAYDSGANTYFIKPGVNDDFADLANTIKTYWRAASPPSGPEFEILGRPKSITKERQGDTMILTLTTNLGEFEAIELQVSEVVEQVLQDPEIKNLLIDFHKTNHFGSTAIGFFVKLWKRMSERDGRFVLCGLSYAEKKVLRITQIHKLWPSYATKQEALEAIKRGDTKSVSA